MFKFLLLSNNALRALAKQSSTEFKEASIWIASPRLAKTKFICSERLLPRLSREIFVQNALKYDRSSKIARSPPELLHLAPVHEHVNFIFESGYTKK
jgi:hypothetical protein